MPKEPAPCRLAVFLATAAPTSVILRRGPSDWAQLVLWDRRSDSFEPGQWFHGRVYERRCDLSPDGRLFIYFAAKHGRQDDDDGVGEAWTAISRPPYFTALALWPSIGSWYGGGVFTSERDVMLDVTCGNAPHPDFQPKGLQFSQCPADSAPWEQRLLRGGWQLVERGFDPRTHKRIGTREIWRRPNPGPDAVLCREVEDFDIRRYGSPYGDTYWLETAGDLLPLLDVSWADWDDERLLFARGGCLFQATVEKGALRETELYDLNPLAPRELRPPDWARKW